MATWCGIPVGTREVLLHQHRRFYCKSTIDIVIVSSYIDWHVEDYKIPKFPSHRHIVNNKKT